MVQEGCEAKIMKATGIVRNVDKLGRIVIPAEIRDKFGIKQNGGLLELYAEEDAIILKKYEPACIFCQSENDIVIFKGKKICKICAKEMSLVK